MSSDSQRAYTLTVTERQLELIRNATELLSRIATGQVYEALSYAPINQEDYFEARGSLLRALEPFISKTYQPSDVAGGCWEIYQVVRYQLAWDRNPKGELFQTEAYEPMQCSREPLPIVSKRDLKMSTSMKYCFFQNLLPELQVLEERVESLLEQDAETVSLDELKAARACFEIMMNEVDDFTLERISEKVKAAQS